MSDDWKDRVRRRIDAFLEWPYADKAALLSALTLVFFVLYGLVAAGVRASPSLSALADPGILRAFELSAWAGAAGWALSCLLGLYLRKRRADSRGYAHLVAQLYAASNMALAYWVGPLTGVTWLVLLGAFAGGLLLFDAGIVIPAGLTAFALLVLGALVAWAGWLPFDPLLGAPPAESDRLAGEYLFPRLFALVLLGVVFAAILTYFNGRLRHQRQRLVELSTRDWLTGVSNRRHFMDLLVEEFERAERAESALAFIMIDLDNFKEANDAAGHLAGDELLRRVAELLQKNVRLYDTIGRYGGDEFVVLAPGANVVGAVQVAERCVAAIREVRAGEKSGAVRASASAGVAAFPAHGISAVDDLIRAADQALYEAKSRGRDRVATA